MVRLGRKAVSLLLVVGSLAAGGIVLAQAGGSQPQAQGQPQGVPPNPPPTPPPGPAPNVPPLPTPPPEEAPLPAGKVEIPLRARANISVPDMVQQAKDYIAKMNDTLKRMVQLQDIARRQKDVIR